MQDDGNVVYELAKHGEVWDLLREWASFAPAVVQPRRRNVTFNAAI